MNIQLGSSAYTEDTIKSAINSSHNWRGVFEHLNCIFNNGRYLKLKEYCETNNISTEHFKYSKVVVSKYPRLEELKVAIINNYSIRGVLIELGLKPFGGNYKVIKSVIEREGLDTSHFTGKSCNTNGRYSKSKNIDSYLVKGSQSTITTHKLKQKLILVGYLEKKCNNCGLTEWLGNDIPLELEHIDGDNTNNIRENLILLCPNCHALTSTYRGKNKKLKTQY